MGELFIVPFALALVAGIFAAPVVAIVALVQARQLAKRVARLEAHIAAGKPAPGSPPRQQPREGVAGPREAAVPVPPEPRPAPAVPQPPRAAVPAAVEPEPAARRAAAVGPRAPSDFAGELGPRLLVATGALAAVAFLAYFVQYAWENDWVGPRGRVLMGAVAGLGLLTAGIRLMRRELRPLGQGLAAVGLAGLYVSAFASHGFYALVPRGLAGFLMIAITASAVVLALRLEARLLATLSWLGGYLAPVLLSSGEDRAVSLFLYLTLLDLGAMVLERSRRFQETIPIAMAGTALLYIGWFANHYSSDRLLVAALGLVWFTALFALGTRQRPLVVATSLIAGSIGAAALCAETNQADVLGPMLLALVAVAIVLRSQWSWAELVGLGGASLATLAWYDNWFRPGRAPEALSLAVPIAAAFLLSRAVRGIVRGEPSRRSDIAVLIGNAALLWMVVNGAFLADYPGWLGFAAAGLAGVHLALGLASLRRRETDPLQLWTYLSLAAGFLTLAIPAQLGVNGITLGWAVEGLILIHLATRFEARSSRWAGFLVLGLAVMRLPLRHDAFVPVGGSAFWNANFAVWLAVSIALLIAARWSRGRTLASADAALGALAAAAGLLILLVGMTGETGALFERRETAALLAGDPEAAMAAPFQGRLAISALWASFATALLASGLALRNRALFGGAYLLFFITAAKLVLVDLAALQTFYRMLSFLVLAVLLIAGAYLNLRFRGRLTLPRERE